MGLPASQRLKRNEKEAGKEEEKFFKRDDVNELAKEGHVKSSPRKGPYGGNATPPSNLIFLPGLGRGNGLPLRVIWGIWNTKLRDLDPWHLGLIADRRVKAYTTNEKTWAGKWYQKHRYYKEIGEEIYRRIVKGKGKSVEEIIDRLEFIRKSIPMQYIHGLVDGNAKRAAFLSNQKEECSNGYSSVTRSGLLVDEE